MGPSSLQKGSVVMEKAPLSVWGKGSLLHGWGGVAVSCAASMENSMEGPLLT